MLGEISVGLLTRLKLKNTLKDVYELSIYNFFFEWKLHTSGNVRINFINWNFVYKRPNDMYTLLRK